MNIINKSFTLDEFKTYIGSLAKPDWLKFIVVHNTSSPTQSQYKGWHSRPGWTMEQWGNNLVDFYKQKGWSGCPHFYVGYDKILVLNDPMKFGVHSPSWNHISYGIEAIAEFNDELFDEGIRDNLIGVLGILHNHFLLDPNNYKHGISGLHFHKDDPATTHKECPGKNLVKADLLKLVTDHMKGINNANNV